MSLLNVSGLFPSCLGSRERAGDSRWVANTCRLFVAAVSDGPTPRSLTCVLLSMIALGSLIGCRAPEHGSEIGDGAVTQAARLARERGLSEAIVGLKIESVDPRDLASEATEMSFVVAKAGRAVVQVGKDRIFTLQHFHAVKWLTNRSGDAMWCGDTAPMEPAAADEIAVGLARGEALIDGVRVREVTFGQIEFERDETYLLVGLSCPRNGLNLIYQENGVLRVGADGAIGPMFGNERNPFVREVLAMGTIDDLEQRLARTREP